MYSIKYYSLPMNEALKVQHLETIYSTDNSHNYYNTVCTLITFTSKCTATGSISHVPQGKLVVLRGTPSKPVVTVVQQLVLKNGYHMVAVPSRSKKKEGVKL